LAVEGRFVNYKKYWPIINEQQVLGCEGQNHMNRYLESNIHIESNPSYP
jgi:hypothetical protein